MEVHSDFRLISCHTVQVLRAQCHHGLTKAFTKLNTSLIFLLKVRRSTLTKLSEVCFWSIAQGFKNSLHGNIILCCGLIKGPSPTIWNSKVMFWTCPRSYLQISQFCNSWRKYIPSSLQRCSIPSCQQLEDLTSTWTKFWSIQQESTPAANKVSTCQVNGTCVNISKEAKMLVNLFQ